MAFSLLVILFYLILMKEKRIHSPNEVCENELDDGKNQKKMQT